MYLELTPQDTLRDLRQLILDAIPGFEFPRKKLDHTLDIDIITPGENSLYWNDIPTSAIITNQDLIDNQINNSGLGDLTLKSTQVDSTYLDSSTFNSDLTEEEVNILAILMMNAWLQRQITSIENIRMKYSGTDFKFTSQANHLSKLLVLLAETQRQSLHMQRLYKRRTTDQEGLIKSNWFVFKESVFDDN